MATAEWASASLVSASVPASATGGGQHLVLDLDQVERLLGDGQLVGGHRGHRLAHEHRAVDREHRVGARGRLLLQMRDVPGGEHRADARQRLGRAHVDRDDPGVRVWAAQQLGVEQPPGLDVGHVLHPARDLLGAVRPRDRHAHSLDVARGLHRAHRALPSEARVSAASLIAATILV
jgi:hypothetical protein